MNPAPYNPDTLKRIREGASAAALGWDDRRYLDICRRHGLEPQASFPVAAAVPVPAVPVARGEIDQPPARPKDIEPHPDVERVVSAGGCCYDVARREVSRGRHTAVLTPGSSAVFMLLAAVRHAAFITSKALARQLGTCGPENVTSYVHTMRPALRRLGLDVRGKLGIGGGYRIADDQTGDPVEVTILNPQGTP